jgi:hypothetical protein
MSMHAYDMWFESGDHVAPDPGAQHALRSPIVAAPDGWVGSLGPSISPEVWPREPEFGKYMNHGITLRLPADYQRRGPDYPGVSFFQSIAPDLWERTAATPELAAPNPRIVLRPDVIGGWGVLLWLTEAELRGPKTEQPDDRVKTHKSATRSGAMVPEAYSPLWLTERENDPNVGRAPRNYRQTDSPGESDYVDPDTHPEIGFGPTSVVMSHLGGTALPAQLLPDNLTPYYLEINEFDNLNFGGGNAQIDLESDVYDWACS